MNKAWKEIESAEHPVPRLIIIIKEAEISRYLIYAHKSKVWYTPNGFMESSEMPTIFRGKDDATEFLLRDPEAGLKEKRNAVEAAKKEVDDYEVMLNGYIGSFRTAVSNKLCK